MAFPRKSFLVTPLTSPEHTLETKVKISVLNLSSKKKKKDVKTLDMIALHLRVLKFCKLHEN